jgi:flagellar export protein FliJ
MTRQKTVSKIIEIKEYTKEQHEAEVKKAREQLNHEQEKLEILEAAYAKTSADLTNKQASGTMPVHEVDLFTTYLKHVGRQIDQQKSVVTRYAEELDKKEKAMIEAYKEQRLFEILHDKIVQGQIKEAALGEQKETDYNFLARKALK